MAGFVGEVTPLGESLELVESTLKFPWEGIRPVLTSLAMAQGLRTNTEVIAGEDYPPFTRSLRDGYAVNTADIRGASHSYHVFLKRGEGVLMGAFPRFTGEDSRAYPIPTGGILPHGVNGVVMLEDTSLSGEWVEIRKAVQAGENIIHKGEEIQRGQRVLPKGALIDHTTTGLLATLGVESLPCCDLRICILSTGDEIVPISTRDVPDGCIRDANAWLLSSLLLKYGFPSKQLGIIPDEACLLEAAVENALKECDVLVLSGGSSVGTRDHCARIMEMLPDPGLLIRGINIAPGKPTLIAACHQERKLVFGLPGHPLSCLTTAFTVLLPLVMSLVGAPKKLGNVMNLPLAEDLHGKTGVEEFIPAALQNGMIYPLQAKSGYIAVLQKADGFIHLPENRETLRRGEGVEVWLW